MATAAWMSDQLALASAEDDHHRGPMVRVLLGMQAAVAAMAASAPPPLACELLCIVEKLDMVIDIHGASTGS